MRSKITNNLSYTSINSNIYLNVHNAPHIAKKMQHVSKEGRGWKIAHIWTIFNKHCNESNWVTGVKEQIGDNETCMLIRYHVYVGIDAIVRQQERPFQDGLHLKCTYSLIPTSKTSEISDWGMM